MLAQIHKQRSIIAVKHQAIFTNEIQTLNSELSHLGLTHPYEMSRDQYKSLTNCSTEYCNGGCFVDLRGQSPETFLYRYTTIENLIGQENWNDPIVRRVDAYETIKKRSSPTSWYKLSNAMSGFYKNRRGFSWWTNELPNKLEVLFRLGLVNNYFKPNSIILRVKLIDKIKDKLNIPSVIDGYDQPIFFPKFIDSNIFSGQTLNLNDLHEFKDGCNEYVLSELNVEEIEAIPLELDVLRIKIWLDDIKEQLLNYYNRH
jgi:hypothetical protein